MRRPRMNHEDQKEYQLGFEMGSDLANEYWEAIKPTKYDDLDKIEKQVVKELITKYPLLSIFWREGVKRGAYLKVRNRGVYKPLHTRRGMLEHIFGKEYIRQRIIELKTSKRMPDSDIDAILFAEEP